jgi:hypothetical protein
MRQLLLAVPVLFAFGCLVGGEEFEPPVRVKADGAPVRAVSPGFAAPCLADLSGEGKLDLLFGQFHKGKIQVFKGLGGGKFAKGTWLQAGGQDVELPEVW